MSEINREAEVALTRTAKDALQGVDVPLRDQIPKKLMAKLNEMSMGEKIANAWRIGNANRTEWLERQQVYLNDWDEFLVSTAEGPFTGSSSLHIPMPLIVAKTLHARFQQAILGIEPYFNLKARVPGLGDRAQLVSDTMSYNLKEWCNYRRGCESFVDSWIWRWVTTGCGIAKARWERQFEYFVDVVSSSEMAAPLHQTQNGQERVLPQIKMVEKEVKVTKKIFEGLVYEDRNPEDVLIRGGGGDPQIADSVTDRFMLTASELWTLADQKIFDEDVVREIIQAGPDTPSGSVNSAIKYQRMHNAGEAALKVSSDLDRFEILEDYRKIDVDDCGITSEIVTWVHYKSSKILRATYLRRINKTGERPFFKIDFHKRTGAEYGVGIIEMLHPLSTEMDAMHNMRIDFGIISNMPFGFYKPTSSINPQTIKLEPGALIPVDNPQTDIYFPNLGNRTSFGFQEEQALQTMIERLTGVNDMSMGIMTGVQGAARTATGANALLGESNANLDVHLRRLNRGWKQLLEFSLHVLQQRIPPGLAFRVTGEDGNDYWQQVKSDKDIEGDFDFELSANSANSNKSIQQSISQQVLQLVSNPLYIQTGAVTVANIYEALKTYLKAMDVKDYAKYITKPSNYQYIMNPEEEANAVLRGVLVPVLPQMDHQGFLDYFQGIVKSDELLGMFNQEQTKLLGAQAKRHEQMLQALQQQQAQQQNLQQMQFNAQQGAQPGGAMQRPNGGVPQQAAPPGTGGGAPQQAGGM